MEKYYFNTDTSHKLSQRITDMINGAETYIKTGNFFFREASIVGALKSAARRGVAVFVLSNLQGADSKSDDARFDNKQNDPHLSNLSELAECGIHVKCLNELHAKFLIADGKAGLVMSANYTYDSLHGNPENGVELGGAEVADLERVFDTAYTYADMKLGRDKSGYTFKHATKAVPPHTFDSIGKYSRLLMTLACPKDEYGKARDSNFRHCNVHTLYDAITKAVDNAQRTAVILSYSYAGTKTMPELSRALANAAVRGAKIKLLYRNDDNPSKVRMWEAELDKLAKATNGSAARVGIGKNHAKCVLTEKEGIMFTANINAYKGMKAGFELGVRLTESQRRQALEEIDKLCDSHPWQQ